MRHIILGAGGAIASVLSRELLASGASVRLVSRSGRDVAGAESVRADLLDPVSVRHVAPWAHRINQTGAISTREPKRRLVPHS